MFRFNFNRTTMSVSLLVAFGVATGGYYVYNRFFLTTPTVSEPTPSAPSTEE